MVTTAAAPAAAAAALPLARAAPRPPPLARPRPPATTRAALAPAQATASLGPPTCTPASWQQSSAWEASPSPCPKLCST